MANKALAIIGMHRSGTSLVAQWLNQSGLFLGENLMGRGVGNLRGHFEDVDFVNVHKEIMKDWGLDANGVGPLPKELELEEEHRRKLSALLVKGNGELDWGWKDPRTCLFLDFYETAFTNLDFLIVYREPLLVVDSLLRRKFEMKRKQSSIDSRVSWSIKQPIVSCVTRVKLANRYWRAWNDYSTLIIDFASKVSPGRVLVCSLDQLLENPNTLSAWLASRGFDLELADLSATYESSLMAVKAKLSEKLVSNEEKARSIKLLDSYKDLSCF